MKERPILFSGPMVRALLSGAKTQTRRIGKTQCAEWTELAVEYSLHAKKGKVAVATHLAYPNGSARHGICECPYGIPGDRLWVRESFMPIPLEAAPGPSQTPWLIAYAAGGQTELLAPSSYNPTLYNYERWTPSIHMPRWASRITLEITSIRVERLQCISFADAAAEGLQYSSVRLDRWSADGTSWRGTPQHAYRELWDSINGPGSWEANPWVWAITFKRLP